MLQSILVYDHFSKFWLSDVVFFKESIRWQTHTVKALVFFHCLLTGRLLPGTVKLHCSAWQSSGGEKFTQISSELWDTNSSLSCSVLQLMSLVHKLIWPHCRLDVPKNSTLGKGPAVSPERDHPHLTIQGSDSFGQGCNESQARVHSALIEPGVPRNSWKFRGFLLLPAGKCGSSERAFLKPFHCCVLAAT